MSGVRLSETEVVNHVGSKLSANTVDSSATVEEPCKKFYAAMHAIPGLAKRCKFDSGCDLSCVDANYEYHSVTNFGIWQYKQ